MARWIPWIALLWTAGAARAGVCEDGRVDAFAGDGLLAVSHSVICAFPGVLREGVFTPLPDPEGALQQLGWVASWRSKKRGGERIVGILDSQVESPGWEIVVARSEDSGQTWEIGPILRKPYYMAQLDGLSLDERGRGELVLVLDDDYGSDQPIGRYVAKTSDGGRSFGPFERIRP